jgi:hypothetical protein
MEPEGSSPYTQEPTTCPYPEPDQCSLCPPPPNLSKIHFNIILVYKQRQLYVFRDLKGE